MIHFPFLGKTSASLQTPPSIMRASDGVLPTWTHLKRQSIKTLREPLWFLVPKIFNVWCFGYSELSLYWMMLREWAKPLNLVYIQHQLESCWYELLSMVTHILLFRDLAELILKLLCLERVTWSLVCVVKPETGQFNIHSYLLSSFQRFSTLVALLAPLCRGKVVWCVSQLNAAVSCLKSFCFPYTKERPGQNQPVLKCIWCWQLWQETWEMRWQAWESEIYWSWHIWASEPLPKASASCPVRKISASLLGHAGQVLRSLQLQINGYNDQETQ